MSAGLYSWKSGTLPTHSYYTMVKRGYSLDFLHSAIATTCCRKAWRNISPLISVRAGVASSRAILVIDHPEREATSD